MTENKADKALRKVIINLLPQEKANGPILEADYLEIDISDKLEANKYYCLESVRVDHKSYSHTINYIPFDDYKQFKVAVEDILDATIVNAKQRASVQRLLDQAFYMRSKAEASI